MRNRELTALRKRLSNLTRLQRRQVAADLEAVEHNAASVEVIEDQSPARPTVRVAVAPRWSETAPLTICSGSNRRVLPDIQCADGHTAGSAAHAREVDGPSRGFARRADDPPSRTASGRAGWASGAVESLAGESAATVAKDVVSAAARAASKSLTSL